MPSNFSHQSTGNFPVSQPQTQFQPPFPQTQSAQNPQGFPIQPQPQFQPQPNFQPSLKSQPGFAPQLAPQSGYRPGPQPTFNPQPGPQPGIMNPNQPLPVGSGQAPTARTDHPLSTHSTLLISELRDGMVIMKDGSFRAVIACQSINFDLMSEAEREGVEYSFQNFLNSLSFTTQILIRSQRVDIGPYIDTLTKIRRNNDNMLLNVLMDDYINFIDILSQEANIMDKSFFIVIPYYSSPDAEKLVQQTKNFFKSFSNTKAPEVTRIDRMTYDKASTEINNRVDAVISGLYQIGIHSLRLNTKELGELYYNFNNPDTAVRQPLIDFNKLAGMYVKKGAK